MPAWSDMLILTTAESFSCNSVIVADSRAFWFSVMTVPVIFPVLVWANAVSDVRQ
jgi:hypothetical protein